MATKRKTTTKKALGEMTADEILKVTEGNKSEAIRRLFAEGMTSRGDIARKLGVKYQFVRNVLVRPMKREQKS